MRRRTRMPLSTVVFESPLFGLMTWHAALKFMKSGCEM